MDPRDEDDDKLEQEEMARRRNALQEEEMAEREAEEAARAEGARRKVARLERNAAEMEDLTNMEIQRERRLIAQMPGHDFDPLALLEEDSMFGPHGLLDFGYTHELGQWLGD
jgi:hypothetical protein